MTAPASTRPTPMRRRRVAALALALAGLASGGLVVAPSGPVGATGRAPSVSASALVGLHRGDRGASVTALQQRLVAFGYVLSVDGVFGSATEHAVAHFQRANGLTPSGVVGATTARYLGVATGSTAASASSTGSSASSASASSGGGLRRGSEGSSVRALQARLARFGYVVEHDGVFGHLTERAVEHFQRANGLTPSGVVDTATARDLGLTSGTVVAPARSIRRARRWPPPRPAAGCDAGVRGRRCGRCRRASPGSATSSSTTACSATSPSAPSNTSSAPTGSHRAASSTPQPPATSASPAPRPARRHRRRGPRAARCRWARKATPWPASSANCSEPASRSSVVPTGRSARSPGLRSGPSSGPTGSRSPAGSTRPRRAPSAPVAPARRSH